ncbi:MAG: hypothetical protein ACOYU7_04095 [Bacillota bacterium]
MDAAESSMIKDRLTRGFIAGLAGGLSINIISFVSYYTNVGELRFLDWAGIMLYGFRSHNFWSQAFAQVVQLLKVGILGVAFAYLLPRTTEPKLPFQRVAFRDNGVDGLERPNAVLQGGQMIPVHPATAVADFIGASVYGLVLAYTLRRLDRRIETDS